MTDRLVAAESIFAAAVDLPREQRAAFLDEKCGDDTDLRALVERLLQHEEKGMSGFLRSPTRARELPSTVLEPPSQIGSYEIVRKLGEGGMAIVYEAIQKKPRRTIALKVIKGSFFDHSLVRRFDLETSILAKLDHPGIARVYDAGETEDGVPYFAMEYVPGPRLTEFAEERELDIAGRLDLMASVCDVVHYAHEVGVIHRDLKPANILVAETPEGGHQPKVLDFGVARAIDAELETISMHTSTGQLVGTLAYMSPEQVTGRSEDLDVRSDVYQLGIILYELLAGRRPYEITGLAVPEAGRVIVEDEPATLRGLSPQYRGDIEAIVGTALAKERERRYDSAGAMSEDIRRYLAHEPIRARPSSGFYRLRRLARRKRETLIGLAIGLVLTIGGTILLVRNDPGPKDLPDAPESTQLTAYPAEMRLRAAAISRDGETLAFIDRRGLHLQDIDSGASQLVALPDSLHPTFFIEWHPTRDCLVTQLRSRAGSRWCFVSRDGSIDPALPALADSARGSITNVLKLSPNGKTWIGTDPEWGQFWLIDEGGAKTTQFFPIESGHFHSQVWSPTGERIAYLHGSGETTDLETTDLQGNSAVVSEVGPVLQGSTTGDPPKLTWLDDGRLVYAQAMAPPNSTATMFMSILLDPTTGEALGEPERIGGWPGYEVLHATAPATSDRLVHMRRQNQDEIFFVDLDREGRISGEPRRFTFDNRRDQPGVWSRDSQTYYFQSGRFGSLEVLMKGIDDLNPTRFFRGTRTCLPIDLTPDGEHLLLSHAQDTDGPLEGVMAILRVPLSGGRPDTVLTTPERIDIRCGDVSGAPCVLRHYSEGTVIFTRLDDLTGDEQEIARAPVDPDWSFWGFGWDLSPNGREIALVRHSGTIEVLDIETREWTEIALTTEGVQMVSYAPNGQDLYISRLNPHCIRLVTRDGEIEHLWNSPREDWTFRPRVSPDGKTLSFGVRVQDEDIWMIEDF